MHYNTMHYCAHDNKLIAIRANSYTNYSCNADDVSREQLLLLSNNRFRARIIYTKIFCDFGIYRYTRSIEGP